MKMNFKYVSMMACAALMAGFTSCSNDGDADVTVPVDTKEQATTVQITLDVPRTRATEGYAGTTTEQTIKEVSLWIFDEAGVGTTTIRHIAVDHTTSVGKAIVTTVETTSGNKVIFVGANLPSVIKGNVTSAGKDMIATYVHNVSMGDLVNSDGYIAMFSQASLTANLVPTETDGVTPAANKLKIKVERMVAKVVAGQADGGASFPADNSDGKWVKELNYTAKQMNRYLFTTKQDVDPNYGGFIYSWDGSQQIPANPVGTYGLEQFESSQDYKAVEEVVVNGKGSDWDGVNCFYVPENMEEIGRKGSNTYISIRAKFQATNADPVTGSFWTSTAADGSVKYFATEAAAIADGGKVSGEYKGGYCYYRIYPVKETGYNVHRNDYYRLRINQINGLGSWKDETKDPNDPSDPPGEPIDPNDALVDVEIEVLNWILFSEEEHVLGR